MDRDPNAIVGRRPGILDDAFRWVANEEGSQRGASLCLPLGVHMWYIVRLHFPTSNNVAEYEVLVNSLCIAIELGI
jgi:hypothetical protein